MGAGYSGTFVIAWTQTELDGVREPALSALRAGLPWRWRGTALRVDGPQGLLRLDGALGLDRLHARVRARLGGTPTSPFDAIDPVLGHGFSVTDGRAAYWLAVLDTASGPLLVCHDGVPPADAELWIVRTDLDDLARPALSETATGIAAMALLDTPDGPRQAGTLRLGDRVMTRDHGPQPIRWIGHRSVSKARLMLMPALRPFGAPGGTLRIAPHQQVLVTGRAATALFNTDEVLAEVRSLERGWRRDNSLSPQCYVQIVLDRHQILRAEGCDLASTHMSELDAGALPRADRLRLERLWPDPGAYGPFARRVLSRPETALVQAA